jgi:hypothetical protein
VAIEPPATCIAEDFQLPYQPPLVTSESSRGAVDLARRLKAAGAKMYGAFWCSHCFEQKQAFGAQVCGVAVVEGGWGWCAGTKLGGVVYTLPLWQGTAGGSVGWRPAQPDCGASPVDYLHQCALLLEPAATGRHATVAPTARCCPC